MLTLNYIGSKKTLFEKIFTVCEKNIKNLSQKTFVDLFAGTGTVGFNMTPHVKTVIANDLEYYSYIISSALLETPFTDKLETLVKKCNGVEPIVGPITEEYSPPARMFFTRENAMKADAIRAFIENLLESKSIVVNEYRFLIASLLVAIDAVANTASVYGAFLKKFKGSSLKSLVMKPIHTRSAQKENKVLNERAEGIELECDILYLDPPYNARQYGANYSPLNFIAKGSGETFGKTGLLQGYNKSDFCRKGTVEGAFKQILTNIKSKWVIVSYNNEGILPFEKLKDILSEGNLILYKIPYKKFKSQRTQVDEIVYEWIWFLERGETKSFSEIIL